MHILENTRPDGLLLMGNIIASVLGLFVIRYKREVNNNEFNIGSNLPNLVVHSLLPSIFLIIFSQNISYRKTCNRCLRAFNFQPLKKRFYQRIYGISIFRLSLVLRTRRPIIQMQLAKIFIIKRTLGLLLISAFNSFFLDPSQLQNLFYKQRSQVHFRKQIITIIHRNNIVTNSQQDNNFRFSK